MNDISPTALLKRLKKSSFQPCNTNLWIIHRGGRHPNYSYQTSWVDTEESLKVKLTQVFMKAITAADSVEQYDYLSSDQDSRAFVKPIRETEFNGIASSVFQEEQANKIENVKQLLGAWMYVIHLYTDSMVPVLGVRKTSGAWSMKKVGGLYNAFFSNNKLVDIKENEIFKIDPIIDFFAYDKFLFILKKSHFESAINFRAGMEQKRDAVLDKLEKLNLFTDVKLIRTACGDNLTFLRRFAQIEKNQYFNNESFMERLVAINKSDNWGLQINDENKIIVTKTNAPDILTFLNNGRLYSPINEERFDAEVKRKVLASG